MRNTQADRAGSALLRQTLHALSPERAYMAAAVACAAGVMVILPLSRPPTAGLQTVAALGAAAVMCLVLAISHRLPDSNTLHLARASALLLVGLLAGLVGWFFGAFSGVSAVVVLAMLLAGTVSGTPRVRWPGLPGWMTYAGLALGQALAFALPFARLIGDRSLVPVFFYFREPKANQVFSHLAIQAVFLVAFLGARAFQKKYRQLAEEVDDAERGAGAREALLEEARADYMRALLAGRRAASAGERRPARAAPTTDPERSDSTLADQAPTKVVVSSDRTADTIVDAAPPAALPDASPKAADARWDEALRTKMRGQFRAVAGLALFGSIVVARIAHDRIQIWVAWISMAAVVATAWYQRRLVERIKSETVYWPWAIIAALSVGPSYAFGFHSSFAAVITTLLFLGGLFRARQRAASVADSRTVVLASLCVAQGGAFLLVYSGLVPDIGNVPVSLAGSTSFEPIVVHLLLQGVYVASFTAGWLVDRRYDALMRRAAVAARDQVRQEDMLATTRAAIERLQAEEGEGIFAGHRVGRFDLVRLFARGGMGDVYEAIERGTGRRVAVKLVRYERAADPTALRLFVTETTALGRVRSPHVAEVLDAGGLDEDLPYVAMEFIDGPTLSEVLRERRQLPLAELGQLVRDVAAGLAAIHRAGIVHRDVKPQNIMRSSTAASAVWKLVDLGVAQTGDVLPNANLIVGTPQYMAPEQALGDPVDARSDLYSLCLVAYRALAGRPAPVGSPPSPRWFAPITQDLEHVFRIGMASAPEDRFASADELASAFEAASWGTLADGIRLRARALLAREPWGSPSFVLLEGRSLMR